MSSELPYRPCVGIMLINAQGRVFAGKRIDQTVEGWQMPQAALMMAKARATRLCAS